MSGPAAQPVAASAKGPPAAPAITLRKASWFTPLAAGLLATLGLLPGLLAVPTIGIYLILLQWAWNSPGLLSIAVGSGTGLVLWLILGVLFSWTSDPARVSSGIFRDLQARYLLIVGRIEAVDSRSQAMAADHRAAYLQATAMRQELAPLFDPSGRTTARVGAQWIGATGYIAAWHAVHRAEEALMLLEADDQVLAAALSDRGRISGSRIPGRDDMLSQSAGAIVSLDAALAGVMGWKGDVPKIQAKIARTVLVNVKKTVNEYRDGLWESLVYLRRRTIQALVFVGLAGYLVIAIALIEGASSTAVAAASAFYMAGAMIGLFHAAYLEQRRRAAVEDYGLSAARLLLLPVIAGIAGVVGAGLTAFLGAPPLGLGLLATPDLAKIFDLAQYPLGLVSAAIFGLTPGLLLDRIRALGDDVKFDIAKSDPSGSEKSDAATNGT
jgi:hypothetical protein